MTGVIRAMRYSKLRKAARKSGLVLERAYPEITKAKCSRCTHDVALSPTSAVALQRGLRSDLHAVLAAGRYHRRQFHSDEQRADRGNGIASRSSSEVAKRGERMMIRCSKGGERVMVDHGVNAWEPRRFAASVRRIAKSNGSK